MPCHPLVKYVLRVNIFFFSVLFTKHSFHWILKLYMFVYYAWTEMCTSVWPFGEKKLRAWMYSVYQPMNYLYKSPWFPRLTEVKRYLWIQSRHGLATNTPIPFTAYSLTHCVCTTTLLQLLWNTWQSQNSYVSLPENVVK